MNKCVQLLLAFIVATVILLTPAKIRFLYLHPFPEIGAYGYKEGNDPGWGVNPSQAPLTQTCTPMGKQRDFGLWGPEYQKKTPRGEHAGCIRTVPWWTLGRRRRCEVTVPYGLLFPCTCKIKLISSFCSWGTEWFYFAFRVWV